MQAITVRRHQADDARSLNDFVVRGESAKDIHLDLRGILRTAQTERGRGVWSDEDPEVWVGGTFVGRLREDGDISALARDAIAHL